jgi:hypothetical protein
MPAEPVSAEPVPAEPGSAEPVSARGPAPDHPTSGHGEITWRPAGTSMVRARRSPQPPVDSPATAANDHLTHRVQAHDVPTSGSGNGAGAPPHGNGLAARVPGANLTHQPRGEAPPAASGVRPRPERVQEMLTRHQRGIREGRDRDGDE